MSESWIGSVKKVTTESKDSHTVLVEKRIGTPYSILEANQMLYLVKLMRHFFPDNIPIAYKVKATGNGYGISMQKIEHTTLHKDIERHIHAASQNELDEEEEQYLEGLIEKVRESLQYREFVTKASKYGFNLEFSAENFIYNPETKSLFFIDFELVYFLSDNEVDIYEPGFSIDIKKVVAAIDSEFEGAKRDEAYECLQNIFDNLPEEAKAEWLIVRPDFATSKKTD